MGGGLRSRRTRRDRGDQQLRSRPRPPPKGRWDFGDGGGRETQERRHLRRNGKSDPIDAAEAAAAAARAVLAGEAVGEPPKSGDGRVEMIRVLRSARRSAVKARSQAANQLRALLVTAPEDLRHRLRQLSTKELVATCCARLRLGSDPDDVHTATRFALRSLARLSASTSSVLRLLWHR